MILLLKDKADTLKIQAMLEEFENPGILIRGEEIRRRVEAVTHELLAGVL
jgi:hypothetical protein